MTADLWGSWTLGLGTMTTDLSASVIDRSTELLPSSTPFSPVAAGQAQHISHEDWGRLTSTQHCISYIGTFLNFVVFAKG